MITPERAEEIRSAIASAQGWAKAGVQYTAEEEAEIVRFWSTLQSGHSFYDAVNRMARGEHLEGKSDGDR